MNENTATAIIGACMIACLGFIAYIEGVSDYEIRKACIGARGDWKDKACTFPENKAELK